jgi:lipopolysaccharide transport system permease protein
VANAGIFGKVYFPRLSIPISIIISNLFKFGIQFVLFALFLVYFKLKGAPIHLTWVVLLTPVLLILMAVLALGTGILISSLTTKYQDLRHVMAFGVQLWMYATPIVYPLSQVPEHLRNYFALNPMTAIVETFKLGFLGVSSIRPEQLIIGTVSTFVILIIGLMLFSRVEKTFMDTV